MNYAVEQRLRLIDFLLDQYGHVNRSAIMNYFGIGSAAATRDFKKYMELAPNNTAYSGTERAYYKTQAFKPLYT